MFQSFRLFQVFGIPVYAQGILLPFVLLMGALVTVADYLTNVVLIVTIFLGPLLLHELGHCLVARRFGIATRRILLTPIGGIASIATMPREPKKEFWIAAAGPLVNFALAGPLILLAWLVPAPFLRALAVVNLFLGVFNLLPGIPLDGGRILRSLLARWMPYLQATWIACRFGQVLALVFVILAFALARPMLLVLGIFVLLASQLEYLFARFHASPAGQAHEMFRRFFAEGQRFGAQSGGSRATRPDGASPAEPPPNEERDFPSGSGDSQESEPQSVDGRVIDIDAEGNVRRIWRRP